MPTKSKSEGIFRSPSPARGRGRPRSRSRSRGRSKSPSRTKSKQSPSPTRKASSQQKKLPKSPSTPTRQSARIKHIVEKQESIKEAAPVEDKGDSSVGTKKTSKAKAGDKYEFGGPVGMFFNIATILVMMYGINLACTKKSCALTKLPTIPRTVADYFDQKAVLVFLGWLLFQVLLVAVPVGKTVTTVPQKGKAQTYRKNGFLSLVLSVATLSALMYFGYPVNMVYDKFLQFMTTATVFSVILAAVLYFKSMNMKESEKTSSGNTGCTFYDFCLGRQMFPKVGGLDLQHFAIRFAANTWVAMITIFVFKARSDNVFTPAMAVVSIFQALYCADLLFFEETLLSSGNFNHDGSGFLLTLISFAVVPFLYCLQPRYLLEHPRVWHPACLAGFIFINLIGYVIYRGSNSEKDRFRRDPHNPCFADFKKIPTSSGKKLLASGWWGLCRHPNYLGDLIMSIAWCLPCGFNAALPFYYPVLLALQLVMLAQRDAAVCLKKHGAGYERYCREVKYKIIPYVY